MGLLLPGLSCLEEPSSACRRSSLTPTLRRLVPQRGNSSRKGGFRLNEESWRRNCSPVSCDEALPSRVLGANLARLHAQLGPGLACASARMCHWWRWLSLFPPSFTTTISPSPPVTSGEFGKDGSVDGVQLAATADALWKQFNGHSDFLVNLQKRDM